MSPASSPARLVASRSAMPKYAGTVMTTSRTGSSAVAEASAATFLRISAEISSGVYARPQNSWVTPALPMSRLMSDCTRAGLSRSASLADSPTTTWSGRSK